MKKTLTAKILLALLAFALIFALAACNFGGGDDNTDSDSTEETKTALKSPVLTISGATVKWDSVQGAAEYSYTIYDADGNEVETKTTSKSNRSVTLTEGQSITVIAVATAGSKYSNSAPSEKKTYVAGALAQVKSIINGADTLIDILNKAQTFLSADVSLGGYIRAGETTNNAALRLQANVDATDPSALISLVGNGETVAALGYAENKLLLKGGDGAFYINLAGFDPSEDALMEAVLEIVKGFNINFSDIASTVNETIDSVGGLLPEDMLKTLINIEAAADGKSVSLGIGCAALNTVLGMTGEGGMLSMIDIDSYASYIDMVPEILSNETVVKVLPAVEEMDLSWMNWDSIKAKIAANKNNEASLLKIIVGYDDNKVINGLDVVIDLSALDKTNLDYEIGLNLDVLLGNTTAKKTAISTSEYKAKEVEIDLGAELGQKGIALDGKAVLYLSNAAKSNSEILAKAIVTAKKGDESGNAVAYATAEGIYVDLSQVFALYDIQDKVTTYKFEYGFNLIDKVNDLVTSADAENAAEDGEEEGFSFGGFDISAIIAGVVEIVSGEGEIIDKIPDLCSYAYETVAGIFGLELTEAEFIEEYVAKYAQLYSQIALEDSFGDIITDIIATHMENEDILLASLLPGENSAAVQVIGATETDGLVAYLAKFAKIPALKDGTEGKEIDKENSWEITKENMKAWVEFALQKEIEAGTTLYDFVGSILGISLDDIIDNGLAFKVEGAITNDTEASVYGLNGAVYAQESMNAEENYAMISGGIFFQAEGTQDTGVDEFDAGNFYAFNQQNDEGTYYIADAFLALLAEVVK